MSSTDLLPGAVAGVVALVLWSFVVRLRLGRFAIWPDRRSRREVVFVVPLWVMSVLWLAALLVSVLVDTDQTGTVVRTVLLMGPIGLFVGVAVLSAMAEFRHDREIADKRVKA